MLTWDVPKEDLGEEYMRNLFTITVTLLQVKSYFKIKDFKK